MRRDYPDRPFVGVGAIVFRGSEVLLVRRGRAPRADEWSLPGGAQEIGEPVLEALHREVREETGIEIEVLGLVDVVDAIFPDDTGRIRHHYTLIDYAARHRSGEPCGASDVAEARYVPLGEMPGLVLWRETVRIIDQAWALHGRAAAG